MMLNSLILLKVCWNFTIFILFYFILFFSYAQLGNLTGIPGITFPIGYDDKGLPIGLQVMSAWWREHVVLRVAHAAETFITRRKPQVYYNLL